MPRSLGIVGDGRALELECALVKAAFENGRVDGGGDIVVLARALHDHGREGRALVRPDEHHLRPADFSFDLLFLENDLLDGSLALFRYFGLASLGGRH